MTCFSCGPGALWCVLSAKRFQPGTFSQNLHYGLSYARPGRQTRAADHRLPSASMGTKQRACFHCNSRSLRVPILSRHALPHAPNGARIGLFGGSFDPAHDGHAHVARHALRALKLDALWMLVSPGNPLKPSGPAPMPDRLARARALVCDPRIRVTAIESQLGTRYTADTLRALRRLYRRQELVWIMGADSLAGFDAWENWREILRSVPVAVIARPGAQRRALASVAARSFAAARVPMTQAGQLGTMRPPAWCFITIPMRDISSSQLRAAGVWQASPG